MPGEESVPEPTGLTAPLIWSGLAIAVLMAFVGWLLVG